MNKYLQVSWLFNILALYSIEYALYDNIKNHIFDSGIEK